jgi:hypothetical protein
MTMTIRHTALTIVAALGLSLGQSAHADEHTTVTMVGHIGVFKALNMTLDDDRTADDYRISTRMVSGGWAVLFKHFDTRATVAGRIAGDALRPTTLTHQNLDGKKNRKTIATWTSDDVLTEATPDYGDMGSPPASKAQRLEAVDPMTALARLTATAPAEACKATLRVYDGKQRYDLVMRPLGTDTLSKGESPALPGASFKCEMRYREIAGFKKKDNPQDEKFRTPITLWLSALPGTQRYVIVRMKADMGFASAVIKATKIEHRP